MDGVGVYLARYTEDDTEQRFSEGVETGIIDPTANAAGEGEHDFEDAYYDYSRVCMPYCSKDEGDH